MDIDKYSYNDLSKMFYDIIDMKSERIEIIGKENDLIAGIRFVNSYFDGHYLVAYGPVNQTDISKIIIGEEKYILMEKLEIFLSIMRNVPADIGEIDENSEGKYFVITYSDSHRVKIVDNGSNDIIVDSYTFNDLLNMFLDIYSD